LFAVPNQATTHHQHTNKIKSSANSSQILMLSDKKKEELEDEKLTCLLPSPLHQLPSVLQHIHQP